MARARFLFNRLGGFAVVAAAVFLAGCAGSPPRKDTVRPKAAIKQDSPRRDTDRPKAAVKNTVRRTTTDRDTQRNKGPVTVGNTRTDIKGDQNIGQEVNILNMHAVQVAKQCPYQSGTCEKEYCSAQQFLTIFSGVPRSEKADKDVAIIMQGLYQNAEISCQGNTRIAPLVANMLTAVNKIVANRN